MSGLFAVAVAMGLAMNNGGGKLQNEDWVFESDADTGFSVAAARYEDGKAIAVQCRRGGLSVVVIGLPLQTSGVVRATSERAGGRSDSQIWRVAAAETGPVVLTSSTPARDARFLRGGGAWTLRIQPQGGRPMRVSLDLPSGNANLDRVLSDCGHATSDERDVLPRALDFSLERVNALEAKQEADKRASESSNVSCIVRDSRLQECRDDNLAVRDTRDFSGLNGDRIFAENVTLLEGHVALLPMLMVRRR